MRLYRILRRACALRPAPVALALLVAPTVPRHVVVHPIHTTLTELVYNPAERCVDVTVRAFADDFGAALARWAHRPAAPSDRGSDVAERAYISTVLTLADRDGHPLPLEWRGLQRSGGVVRLFLRASAPGGLGGTRIANRSLFELYDDQINIVQAEYGGRRPTLLFTKGAAVGVLPQ